MSRLRDHRPRFDTRPCPDPDGCRRLFHGSLASGAFPGEICECCGQEISNDTARTAPARPDAMTGGTPTDTEEPQP